MGSKLKKYLCIHGHFYQPPRENPWIDEVELQESAYPYHDWNERISSECYARNAAARILDTSNKIIDIVNTYSKISFNFGPTLLSWMERRDPEAYKAVLQADKVSQENFSGHGAAIAQAYNHIIMPLANKRDKHTQILWGIRDFEHRFQRRPEGMWLSETAVDIETLELLAECDIKFTILAPHQAKRVKKIEDHGKWKSVLGQKIDTKMPYKCKLPSGKNISIFFYDGPIAQAVGFEGLLNSGENFANRLISAFSDPCDRSQLVHMAGDGETYGHHHKFGDMALAYCLYLVESNNMAKVTIYGEYLEKYPPTHEVEILENSSWSCPHGIDRWRNDCGCSSGANPTWNQKWRAPLREALDWLRDALASVYEKEANAFTQDVWRLRDSYIDVILNRNKDNIEKFLIDNAINVSSKEEKIKLLKLLEIQHNALLMYTSCGWYFDEISGIETVQIIKYAARAIQLSKETAGVDFEGEFIKILEKAESNIPECKNGARLYETSVKPSIVDLVRVGAHYAVSSLFEEYSKTVRIYSYTVCNQSCDRSEIGKQKLAVGTANISSDITWEERHISFAVLHRGDHNLICGVNELTDEKASLKMHQEIKDAFKKNDVHKAIRLIGNHFSAGRYSLWHLFRDEQTKILYQILASTLEEIEVSLRKINEYHSPIFQVVKQLRIPLPKVLANTVQVMLNTDLLKVLGRDIIDSGRLRKIVDEVKEWSLEIDKVTLGFVVNRKVNSIMAEVLENPQETWLLESVETLLSTIKPLELELDLWKAQNIYFSIGKQLHNDMTKRAGQGDEGAKRWVQHFDSLGDYLEVKIT